MLVARSFSPVAHPVRDTIFTEEVFSMTFELDMDKIKEQSLQFVEMAKKTAVDLADKGKNHLDLINEQTQLSKAERQLGALVYSLHKSGEENQPLLDKYLENIEEIHARIEAIKARMTPAEADEAAKTAADTADVVETAEAAAPEEETEEEDEFAGRPTKTCPVCSAKVDIDALFCNHCGAQL